MADYPTFEYQGDQIIAKHGSQIIASGADFQKVAKTADEYFESLRKARHDKSRESATHIITPNGQKARILGHTQSLWDEEITVRFDNGEIRHYATSHGEGAGLRYIAEAKKSPNNVKDLREKLNEPVEPTMDCLLGRLNRLEEVSHTAHRLILESKSASEQVELDRIVLEASQEKQEVKEAIAHITDRIGEAMTPPKRQYQAVAQADLGHSDSWLEVVASEMIRESESQDFDKLLQEGPTILVSSLELGALGDAGTVREIALNHVTAKTAGFQGEKVEEFRMRFVAAAEMARRKEFSYRAETAKTESLEKEASVEDIADESLFM